MSAQRRFLLDNVTARHILTGLLKLAEARELLDEEALPIPYCQAGLPDVWCPEW